MFKDATIIGKGIYSASKGAPKYQVLGLIFALRNQEFDELEMEEILDLIKLENSLIHNLDSADKEYEKFINSGLAAKCCGLLWLPYLLDEHFTHVSKDAVKEHLVEVCGTRDFDYARAYIICDYICNNKNFIENYRAIAAQALRFVTSINTGALRDLEYEYACLFVVPENVKSLQKFLDKVGKEVIY